MTHGTIIQCLDGDGRPFVIIIINEVVLFNTIKRQ
jgi:hypothetical protein